MIKFKIKNERFFKRRFTNCMKKNTINKYQEKQFILLNTKTNSCNKIFAYNRQQNLILDKFYTKATGILIISSMNKERIFYNYIRSNYSQNEKIYEFNMMNNRKYELQNFINKKILIKTSHAEISAILLMLLDCGLTAKQIAENLTGIIFQDMNIYKNKKSLFADIVLPNKNTIYKLDYPEIYSENEMKIESFFEHYTNFSDILKRNLIISEYKTDNIQNDIQL